MRDQLTTAIQQRRIVTFTYQGFARRVQPAAFGVDAGGKDTLHAYQVDGQSKRGGIPHWRNFHTDEITGLAVLDEVFGPNPPGFRSPFPTTHAVLGGSPSGSSASPSAKADQVIPGVPISGEQAAKAVEAASKALGSLGKWFRKR